MYCQFPKNLGIGFGLALRRNGWAVEQYVGMPIRQVNIPVLQLGGGGQDVVSVVSCVGLKMLQHHREQIFACKALHHAARLGCHRHGVAVVDHQRLDFWPEAGRAVCSQVVANRAHVDGAGLPAGVMLRQQVRPLQCAPVHRKPA